MTATLLPPVRTAAETALDLATARIGDVETPLDRLWRPEACPAALLPWLGWALSVDVWDAGWSEETKRSTIAEAIPIHRRKGTRASVERAIRGAGFGDAVLVENQAANRHDGAATYDGAITHARSDHWAEYRLVLSRPVTIRQAAQVRRILAETAPARCHLKAADFTAAAYLHDGACRYDGAVAHGVS